MRCKLIWLLLAASTLTSGETFDDWAEDEDPHDEPVRVELDREKVQRVMVKVLELQKKQKGLMGIGLGKLLLEINGKSSYTAKLIDSLNAPSWCTRHSCRDDKFRETASVFAMKLMDLKRITADQKTWLEEYGRAIILMGVRDAATTGMHGVGAGAGVLAEIMSRSLREDGGKTYVMVRRNFQRLAKQAADSRFYELVDKAFGIEKTVQAAVSLACHNAPLCPLVGQNWQNVMKAFKIENLRDFSDALVVGALAIELWPIVQKLGSGEIAAAEAAALATQAVVQAGAAWVGSALGATVGLAAGTALGYPVLGEAMGAAVGAWLAGQAGKAATETFFSRLFNLSRDRRKNEAYEYFGATPATPTDEIKARYRAQARKLHPDKNGNLEEFLKLNTYLEIIREDRDDDDDDEEDEEPRDEL